MPSLCAFTQSKSRWTDMKRDARLPFCFQFPSVPKWGASAASMSCFSCYFIIHKAEVMENCKPDCGSQNARRPTYPEFGTASLCCTPKASFVLSILSLMLYLVSIQNELYMTFLYTHSMVMLFILTPYYCLLNTFPSLPSVSILPTKQPSSIYTPQIQ